MGIYTKSSREKKFQKPQNYACQICRASREICERCHTGYLMRVATPPVLSDARRERPRPAFPVYN